MRPAPRELTSPIRPSTFGCLSEEGKAEGLRFSLQDVPPDGLHVVREVGQEDLHLEEDCPGIRDVLSLTAMIRAEDSEFWVEGELKGLLVHECVRCLGEFTSPANISFHARYRDPRHRRTRRKDTDTREGTRDLDAVEFYPVVKQRIALHDLLREHVILSVPMQPLCSDGCRGLCQTCGHSLNVSACGCEETTTESPFAVLRAVRKSSANRLA